MILETILGGVTGLIGNIVSGWFKLKQSELDYKINESKQKHEIAMTKAKTQAMITQAKAEIKVTQAQVEGAVDLKDAEAYKQNQKEGNKALFGNKWIDALLAIEGKWKIITLPVASLVAIAFGFVDFLRGLIRPSLTIYLCGVTTWVTWMAWKIMQADGLTLTNMQATEIFNGTTSIVTYLTVSCVTWWFGDRRMAKSIMQSKGIDNRRMEEDINI